MMIALPVYIIFQWIFIDIIATVQNLFLPCSTSSVVVYNDIVHLNQVAWTPLSRLIGCSAQLIEFIPCIGIIYYLSNVFHSYEIGEIFTMKNAQCYYRIGILLFFDALLAKPISGGLWVLAATLSNPVGHRCIRISIGTPNIMALLMGLLVIFISWVMIEGSKIQDEQQLII